MKWYDHTATEAGFLLGGIGTGTVTLGSDGGLRDWELFNRPDKGGMIGYGFFAVHTETGSGKKDTRVLRAKQLPPYTQGRGYHPGWLRGMPSMDGARLGAEYPFAMVEYRDGKLPAEVSLKAFNPFIPLNAEDSGIPGAVFRYTVKNPGTEALTVTLAASMPNLSGYRANDVFDNMEHVPGARNRYREEEDIRGVFLDNPALDPNHPRTGSVALLTDDPDMRYRENWLAGGWWDGMEDFWDAFSRDGSLGNPGEENSKGSRIGPQEHLRVASVSIRKTLQPGESRDFSFVLAWHFPNRVKAWDEDTPYRRGEEVERNYYALRYPDAWAAGSDLLRRLPELEGHSEDFRRAMYESTVPEVVKEAVCDNLTVLRSTTCFRISDGTFLAFEGSHEQKGSCPGTCTHVWNYAQAAAFLFPELEKSARRVEFSLETREDGMMAFRTEKVFGRTDENAFPAADGQFGTIVRLYREWKLTGDDEFLKSVWENAVKALEYGIRTWDLDGDGVLDGQQHNTYDIEFYGMVPMTNSIFYAALLAAAQMARHLGQEERAARWEKLAEEGSQRMDELLWGGEYYVQKLEHPEDYRFQFGRGCLADQIVGQFMAHVNGLGYLFPEEHVKRAVQSIFACNYRDSFEGTTNVQRTYALGDDKGLVLCSWPGHDRPLIPFSYSDEVWSGVEYQVASHLIYEGCVEEGIKVVEAVRSRYDGYKRNPWDEVECGFHYARSLASYALLLALSGFHADVGEKKLWFAPQGNPKEFRSFFCCGAGWGVYERTQAGDGSVTESITPLYGNLDGFTLCGEKAGR